MLIALALVALVSSAGALGVCRASGACGAASGDWAAPDLELLAAALLLAAVPAIHWLRAHWYWRRPIPGAIASTDIAAAADLVLIEVSNDGRIVWAKGAAADVLGHPLQHLRGKALWQLELESGVPVARSRVVRSTELVRAADGTLRPVDVVFRRESDGRLFGLLRPGNDPTLLERAREEAEVRLVEADGSALQSLLATAQNGMALIDSTGYPTFANSAFYGLLGVSDASKTVPALFELITTGADELRDALAHVRSGNTRGLRIEIGLQGVDGAEREAIASISPYRIRGEIEGTLIELADVTEERRAVREIERLARFDDLTGLPNRRYFEHRVREHLRARAREDLCALLLLDLDGFKAVNDSLGHSAGDTLLIEMSRRLEATFGARLLFGRMGGDEFLVLVPALDSIDDARAIADEVQRTLGSPVSLDDLEVTLSASIGIAVYPHDGDNFESLARHADAAMYRAKRRGGDAFEFVSADPDNGLMDEMQLQAALRQAFERSEFELHYQPQFVSGTLELCGVEALLRWGSAERGLVMPDEFIASLENSGLIVQVGEFVLRAACTEAAGWVGSMAAVPVSVNVAARQLLTGDFPRVVRGVLEETGLEPRRLSLEITETAGIESLDDAVAALEELRRLGVRVAIDDFGTGHSSLARLKALPVDTLKLDRSFVASMDSEDGFAFVQGMVSLGRALGMEIVAEGVETRDQLRRLRELECDVIQGFLLANPVPGVSLPAELSRSHEDRQVA